MRILPSLRLRQAATVHFSPLAPRDYRAVPVITMTSESFFSGFLVLSFLSFVVEPCCLPGIRPAKCFGQYFLNRVAVSRRRRSDGGRGHLEADDPPATRWSSRRKYSRLTGSFSPAHQPVFDAGPDGQATAVPVKERLNTVARLLGIVRTERIRVGTS